MYGKVYLIAFSIVAIALSNIWDNYLPIVIYIVWLLLLFFYKRVTNLLIVLCFVMLGFTFFYFPTFSSDETSLDNDQLVFVKGKIISQITVTNHKIEFTLKTLEKEKIRLLFYKEDTSRDEIDNLYMFANCKIKAKNNPIHPPTNPHQFDFQKYLKQNNIKKQMTLSALEDIQCDKQSEILRYFESRTHLIQKISTQYSPYSSAWIRALVLGDTSGLEEDVIDLFQRWGISHLLAISGLHVGIVVALVYFILLSLGIFTKNSINLLLMVFLVAYAWFAGGQPSVLRASIMVAIGLIYLRNKQTIPIIDIISVTFILLFIFNPFFIFQVGFQLSFAVTFSIILSQKWLKQSTSSIMLLFKISFISQMAILPFQIHYFSIFEPLSIILNIVIVPYFSFFVIPLAFVLCLLSLMPLFFSKLLISLFDFIHINIVDGLFYVDKYLYNPFILKSLTVYEILIYYVLLWALMIAFERNIKKQIIYYAISFLMFFLFLNYQPYLSPYGKLTILDMGQGDAIVLELPYRKGIFFIDIGGIPSFYDNRQESRTYQQVIKPFLYGEGIKHIDGVFLSHDDYDHYGSLRYLLEDYPIKNIFVSEFFDQALIIGDDVPFTVLRKNELIQHENYKFKILHPSQDMGNENDNSLVFSVKLGPLNWLFTGDISAENEKQLVKDNLLGMVNALKVAHHGSDTSTSLELLNHVNGFAVIPVGRNNRYGHPSEAVLQRMRERGLDIYRTDKDGAIQYIFTESSYKIKTGQ